MRTGPDPACHAQSPARLLCVALFVTSLALVPTVTAQDEGWEQEDGWDQAASPEAHNTDDDVRKGEKRNRLKRKTKKASRAAKPRRRHEVVDAEAQTAIDRDKLPMRLGASLGFFFEDGAIRDDNRVEALVTNLDQEYDADLDPSVMLQLWLPLSKTFRLSTGLRYGGTYDVSTGEDDDDVYVFGHQMEAHAGLEAWIDVFGGLDVIVGLRGGFGAIFPTDDLDAEIERVQGQGANAWSTPRLGLLLTPMVGARWELGDVVAIRGDVAVSFGRYFLFNYSGTIAGAYYERSAIANFTRYEISAGIEFAFGDL